MSRVVFLNLDEGQVVAHCLTEKIGISALEYLPGGGVRLVCKSGEGAGLIAAKLKKHLLDNDVTRQRHRPVTPLW